MKRIDRLMASDLKDPGFAAEIGVNIRALRSWKLKLGRTPRSNRPRVPKAKPTATFVEVAVPPQAADLELLVIEPVEIRVPVGLDEDTLRPVLSALRRSN